MSTKAVSIESSLSLTQSKYQIPQIGFGVYKSPQDVCVNSCKKAFDAGYRHIDTAQYYENETQVGRALAESGLPREKVYITSKILSAEKDVESTYNKIVYSVEKLAGKDGYADLFLIHSPNGGPEARKLMWQALVLAKERGQVRDIGVSNYGIQHIEEIKSFHGEWPPVVNQIEVCPTLRLQSHDPSLTNVISSTLGASSAKSSSTAKSTTSSSRPTAPLSATRKRMTRPSSASLKNITRSPTRFSSDGVCRRDSSLFPKATHLLELLVTQTSTVSNSTRMI
jgi:hypothetical protein